MIIKFHNSNLIVTYALRLIVIIFQSIFYIEIYKNNYFFIFKKIIFDNRILN